MKHYNPLLKSIHPNAWKFLSDLNNIIIDFECEYQRLEQALNIKRNPKQKDIVNAQFRMESNPIIVCCLNWNALLPRIREPYSS